MRLVISLLCALLLPTTGTPHRVQAKPQPRPTKTSKAKEKKDEKDKGIHVLLVGDSLMATALGQRLELWLKAIPGVSVERVARSATGLARPDVYNWPVVAARAVKRTPPTLVILLIGSNDGQDLIAPKHVKHPKGLKKHHRGRPVRWGKAAWSKTYRKRVDQLLEALGARTRLVLWMGLPPMRSRSLEKKLAVVRREQRAGTLALGSSAQYIGLFPLVRHLRAQAPRDKHGRPRKGWLLKGDGVHFSYYGSLRFARLFEPILWPWIARALVRVSAPTLFSPR